MSMCTESVRALHHLHLSAVSSDTRQQQRAKDELDDDMAAAAALVKIGTWGSGDHGSAYDIDVTAAPPQRLESISLRYGKIIDCVSFTYRDADGEAHAAGPWGGAGGVSEETITLGAGEYVTEVAGSVGPIGDLTHTITSLKFVTNRGTTYGPFGRGDGTPFNVPVLNNGSVVAMFARAEQYLDAIGFYILPF